MERNIIHEQIELYLESLSEQHNLIKKETNKISEIELDIFLSEIRSFYELAKLLERKNSLIESPILKNDPVQLEEQIEEKANETVIEPLVQSEGIEEEIVNQPVFAGTENVVENIQAPEFEEIVTSGILKEEIKDDEAAVPFSAEERIAEENENYIEPGIALPGVSEEAVITSSYLEVPEINEHHSIEFAEDVLEEEPLLSEVHHPTSIAEKYKEEPSLYDKIAKGHEDKSFATKMQKKPIADLRTAIGINERFLFISQLFNGKSDEYNNSIEFINNSSSLELALTHLKELSKKYLWSKDNISVHDFIELVERRFLK